MTVLEQKALLGDKKAQKECSEKGILLPCPMCGKTPTIREYYDTKRGLYNCEVVCCVGVGCTSIKETSLLPKAIRNWNNRAELPIGRCKDCLYKDIAKVNDKGFLICPASNMEITNLDYCSYFEPAKEEKHESCCWNIDDCSCCGFGYECR